jgi:hypothetical protein
MSDPKQATGRPMSEDPWAVGQLDDGSIPSYTEEEARRLSILRDADQAAFDEPAETDEDREFRESSQGDDDDEE